MHGCTLHTMYTHTKRKIQDRLIGSSEPVEVAPRPAHIWGARHIVKSSQTSPAPAHRQRVLKTEKNLAGRVLPNSMPPDERSAGEEQQLSPSSTMSKTVGPPASGWIRNTDLVDYAGLSTPDRHKVLRELSQVGVLL